MRVGAQARSAALATSVLIVAASMYAAQARAGREPSAMTRNWVEAGPIVQRRPSGAQSAADGQELARLLDDPHGPAEIWLPAGEYDGDFVIRRPVSLRAERGAILNGTGHGTVLSIEADDVRIDNVVVRHSGRRHTLEDAGIRSKGARTRIQNVRVEDSLFGVTLGPCRHCEVQHSHVQGSLDDKELKGDGIKLWESDDSVVRNCSVDHVRDVVVWYSKRVLLEGNSVGHSRYGSHFMYAHDGIVRDSRVTDNVVGIFVMYSARLRVERNVLGGAHGAAGVGIGFKESDGVQVSGNWIVANTTGVYLDGTPRAPQFPVHFTDNVFSLNDVAVRFHGPSDGLFFKGNDFHENTLVAEVEGGGDALAASFRANHFTDYVGYDLDGNGTGDVAYQIKRLSGELTEAHATLKFFEGTV
ncbi:MAG TPA: right-handed parallel beta-helix repeat-containing protein, partial [Polyangiales bacterium]